MNAGDKEDNIKEEKAQAIFRILQSKKEGSNASAVSFAETQNKSIPPQSA